MKLRLKQANMLGYPQHFSQILILNVTTCAIEPLPIQNVLILFLYVI
jgi:hypothetical protein